MELTQEDSKVRNNNKTVLRQYNVLVKLVMQIDNRARGEKICQKTSQINHLLIFEVKEEKKEKIKNNV